MKAAVLLIFIAPAMAQPIGMDKRVDLQAISEQKKIECKNAGGCFVLTYDELLAGLKAANSAGRKSVKKEPS